MMPSLYKPLDPREYNLPAPPITIEGATAPAYGAQTLYAPISPGGTRNITATEQGVSPQVGSYLTAANQQAEAQRQQEIQQNMGYRFVPDAAQAIAQHGKDVIDYYEGARAEGTPRQKAWEDANANSLAREKQAAAGQSQNFRPYYTDAGADPSTNRLLSRDARTGAIYYADSLAAGTPEVYRGSRPQPGKLKTLPSGDAGSLAKFNTLADDIGGLISKEADITKYTGPILGRYNTIKSKLVDSPEFVDLNNRARQAIRVAYALSGKQISEKEMALLEDRFIPTAQDPSGNFVIKLERLNQWLNDERSNAIQSYSQAGYDMSGFGVVPKMPRVGGGPDDLGDMSDDELLRQLGVQ